MTEYIFDKIDFHTSKFDTMLDNGQLDEAQEYISFIDTIPDSTEHCKFELEFIISVLKCRLSLYDYLTDSCDFVSMGNYGEISRAKFRSYKTMCYDRLVATQEKLIRKYKFGHE